ncbi:MAG: hypothetical protein JO235_12990 [Chroococcidiopsidaceae cyanobacterium CP_BM_RX_35]|nr:hypothetical protein [Chroococcidiopsidaceae cyanobacterium CP_BM_RX_35]
MVRSPPDWRAVLALSNWRFTNLTTSSLSVNYSAGKFFQLPETPVIRDFWARLLLDVTQGSG